MSTSERSDDFIKQFSNLSKFNCNVRMIYNCHKLNALCVLLYIYTE